MNKGRRSIPTAAFLLGILCVSSSGPAASGPTERVFTLPELEHPRQIVADKERVYFVDGRDIVVYYLSDGLFLKRIGKLGQGPGEFAMGPNRLAVLDNRLIVKDQWSSEWFNSEGIRIYDSHLKLKREFFGELPAFPAAPPPPGSAIESLSAPFQRRGISESKKIVAPALLRRPVLVVPEEKIQQNFPQPGHFFESMPMPGIGDRQIQELESPEKGFLTVLRIAFMAPVQGSLDLAPDVGQLAHQGKTVPSARCQRRMLNFGHITNRATTSTIFSLMFGRQRLESGFPGRDGY